MCLAKVACCLNPMEQTSQTKGFSPVWISLCLSMACFCVNDWSQRSQGNGFSPVCVRMWRWGTILK